MTTAFLVVDVQNDFCEGGSLPVTGGGDVARAISAWLRDHRDDYAAIVATRDEHVDPGAHFSDEPDFVDSWPPHCVKGAAGASFHPDLDVVLLDDVAVKGHHTAAYSGFEGALRDGHALADGLRAWGVDAVEVAGLATDHCVRATALDAARLGFATTVRLDLSAGVAQQTTRRAIDELRTAGVAVVDAGR